MFQLNAGIYPDGKYKIEEYFFLNPNSFQVCSTGSISFNIFALMEMEWETYLEQKKINGEAYQKGNPEQYQEFKELFYQLSPNSFTAQKLFLLNCIRRQYPLLAEEAAKPAAKPAARPVFKPKTK